MAGKKQATMAMPASAEVATDVFWVDVDDIVVDPKENSRRVKAEDVKAMRGLIETHGQQSPVFVRRVADGKWKLVYGFTRHAAITKMNADDPENTRKIQVKVVPDEIDDATAFTMSVVENFGRKNPNMVELAEQQRKLMEEFGKSEDEVAATFGWKGSDGLERLRQMQKLLKLPKSTRDLVAERELPVVAAISLVGLEEAEQKDILKNADRIGNRIKGESVRRAATQKKRDTAAETGNGSAPVLAATRKEIVDLIECLTGPAEDVPVKTLFNKLADFAAGKITRDTAEKWCRSLGGLVKNPKPKPKPEPEQKPEPKAKAAPAPKAAPKAATLAKKGIAPKKMAAAPVKQAKGQVADDIEPEPEAGDVEPEPEVAAS